MRKKSIKESVWFGVWLRRLGSLTPTFVAIPFHLGPTMTIVIDPGFLLHWINFKYMVTATSWVYIPTVPTTIILLLFVRLTIIIIINIICSAFPVGFLFELLLHQTFCTFSTSPQTTGYLIFGFSIGRGYMNSIMDMWLWKKRNPCFIAYLLWKLNMKYNFLFLFSQEISKSRMKRIGIFKKMKKKKEGRKR